MKQRMRGLRRARASSVLLLAGAAVLCATGCGDAGPERATVTGTVRLNGQPVKAGSIAFYPTEGTRGPSAGGAIEDGRYRVDSAKGVVVGKSRVQVNSLQKSGRMIPDAINPNAMMEEYVEAIPPQYNSESTLIREIAVGENRLDFDLTGM